MAFDLSRLRRGERIAAGGGVLLFILMFFDWYTVSVDGGSFGSVAFGGSAWDVFSFVDIYLLIVILAALGLAFLAGTQRTPALPITASVIVTALAAFGTLLVLYRLVDTPFSDVPDGVDIGRTVWAFLGLIAVAGIAYGGYLAMRDEGTTLADAKEQARAAGSQARSAFDNAAPRSEPPASPPPPPPSEPPAGAAPPSSPPPPAGP